jgi:hypothetical protein
MARDAMADDSASEANSAGAPAIGIPSRGQKLLLKTCVLLLVTGFIASLTIRGLSPRAELGEIDGLRQKIPNPQDSHGTLATWGIRVFLILLALAGWHATQFLIGTKKGGDPRKLADASIALTDTDVLLRLTAPANRFLNAHPKYANALLVISSAIIDQLGVFLLLLSIIGPSIRPFVGLLILLALRQVCQALTSLPPPVGMIWRNPGFPSIFVTYGVANDLFFSGHTAVAVYGAFELAMGSGWLAAVAIAIVLFEIGTVLVLRAHYAMDIFTGMIAALLAAGIATWIGPVCDLLLLRMQGY